MLPDRPGWKKIAEEVDSFYRGKNPPPEPLSAALLIRATGLGWSEIQTMPANSVDELSAAMWARTSFFYKELSESTQKGFFALVGKALYLLVLDRIL